MAEIPEWQAQINFENSDYQAAGKKIKWAIPQGYSVTLTFTETVIKDARLLKKVFDGLGDGTSDAVLNFQGVLRGHNDA